MNVFVEENSNSIIDTSLTELSFIFFFILLMVSAWQINSVSEELELSHENQETLKQEVLSLSESLKVASEFAALSDEYDPESLFIELAEARKATQQLESTLQEKTKLEEQLKQLTHKVASNEDAKKQLETALREKAELEKTVKKIEDLKLDNLRQEELIALVEEYQEIIEAIEINNWEGSPSELIASVIQQNENYKGQNINLREKIKKIGNGLEHPPCWADSETGKIQYLFNVVINEDSVEFLRGWPDSRNTQAVSNPNIFNVIGKYDTNNRMWSKTKGIFSESVKLECRHFVRIYDHSESKRAFLRYLLGVENHFYKYLSRRKLSNANQI
ncbi:hypothetical protein BIT28_15560 [Photobacterium proteolyticum]|uniref:Uncharacterized protein n=1 Tax=Photobacterium proteolyticum TaxID=1903952 RepID=A0A1Q9G929_9GAMM|nr:hypothetical protein [Photobacterium proteolyticum]OLQ70827.1 hypothetical protein BIT28_15560 [Photobacterium proteolyticum]